MQDIHALFSFSLTWGLFGVLSSLHSQQAPGMTQPFPRRPSALPTRSLVNRHQGAERRLQPQPAGWELRS